VECPTDPLLFKPLFLDSFSILDHYLGLFLVKIFEGWCIYLAIFFLYFTYTALSFNPIDLSLYKLILVGS